MFLILSLPLDNLVAIFLCPSDAILHGSSGCVEFSIFVFEVFALILKEFLCPFDLVLIDVLRVAALQIGDIVVFERFGFEDNLIDHLILRFYDVFVVSQKILHIVHRSHLLVLNFIVILTKFHSLFEFADVLMQ